MERKRLEDERPDPSAGWTGAGLAMNLLRKSRDLLKRYGLAVALAGLALSLRGVLPFPEGTAHLPASACRRRPERLVRRTRDPACSPR